VTPRTFLIEHRPSSLWWKPDRCGYTREILEAGLYSEDEARRIERLRTDGLGRPQDVPVPLAEKRALLERAAVMLRELQEGD